MKNGSPKTTTAAKRCAIYTRKSTSEGLEQEFNSLDAQREACEHYVRAQAHLGWTFSEQSYDDGGFTGANPERPAFQRLLADIEARQIDVVVVYKVDRLSRSLLDFAKMMERFNAAGASFVSVTQNFSTADAMGRLTLNMLMSFAEFEREMIGERTRDKIAASRRRGKWTGGPVPLGYEVKDKHLVVNELEAVAVREIFDLYLEHRSTLVVARLLNERKRATKRHQAGNGKLREAHEWDKNDVSRVLRNAVYAGFMPLGDELHEGEHEAIVDRALFTRGKALLDVATTRGSASKGRNPDYILRGVLFCARCSSAFTPASTRKNGREFRYYRCVKRDKQGTDRCPSRQLPAQAIEEYVVERLREVAGTEALAVEVTAKVKARVEARRKDLLIERRDLPAEIAKLSDDGRRLIDTARDINGPGKKLLDQRLEEVGEHLGRLESRLAEVERELATLEDIEVEAGWVCQCLADFGACWDVLTPENRGRLVRAIVQRIEVDEPANRVEMHVTDLAATVPLSAVDGGNLEEVSS
jgi:DNA invertase Pin-like site-specific DNA recombinase